MLHNELPLNHPRRGAVEEALRNAFAGLGGRWNVIAQLSGGLSLVIIVLPPDYSAWVIKCDNPRHWNPKTLGATVRAVCRRRGWVNVATAGRHSRGAAKQVGRPAAIPRGARRAAPRRKGRGTT